MSIFEYLSPGVKITETDQSFISGLTEERGPIIIGRTRKGPANKPIKIKNLDEFVSVFGLPVDGGKGPLGDIWREGNTSGPTYASYAAQAWLASEQSPVTMVRLAGEQKTGATGFGQAGWELSGTLSSAYATNGTAYGLFLIQSASANAMTTGSLAAVFYADKGYLTLSGDKASDGSAASEACTFIKSADSSCEFKLQVWDEGANPVGNAIGFNFSRTSPRYIRSVMNTNPQLTNEDTVASSQRKTYWLGESFTRELEDLSLLGLTGGQVYGILMPLQSGSVNWADHREGAQESKTGWVFSQKETNQEDLFRLVSLHVGEDIQRNYMIGIEDIALPTNQLGDDFGTFTVSIRSMAGDVIERFTGCNLNESSNNYIARKIGDEYYEWKESDNKYVKHGEYINKSNIVRVEMKGDVDYSGKLPAGFRGPVRPKGFTLAYGSTGAQALADAVNSGTRATNVIADPSTPVAHSQTIIVSVGGSTVLTITTDTGVTYTATPTLVGATHTLGLDGATTASDVYAALAYLIDQLDDVSAVANGGTSVTISADIIAQSTYDILVTGTYIVGGHASSTPTSGADSDDFAGAFVKGNDSVPSTGGDANNFVAGPTNFTASFLFPSVALRQNGTEGGAPNPYRVHYGIRPKISSLSNQNDLDYVDYLRRLPSGIDSFTPGDDFEYSFSFTLDDLVIDTAAGTVTYTSGSGDSTSYSKVNTFGALLDKEVRQFMMPMWGGFEGWDIKEKEPLRDDLIGTTSSESTNYLQYTLNKALSSVSADKDIPGNLLLVPGIKKPLITDKIIAIAEERKDVLAIIDLENDYIPKAERDTADSDSSCLGSVSEAVSSLKDRALNSSYACAFYPWVQISDNLNGGSLVWIPPSVAALGAFGKSQAQSDVWFAPAGFNRGGLGYLGGQRGPKVIQARQRLDSQQRDLLYQVGINPIATFPAEGVVIFGQKTLLAETSKGVSSLSRINVRRLLIYLKEKVGEVAINTLFDQNTSATWNRFKADAQPVLADVQARFGLSDYKIILDETTTTSDMIDRNVLYTKIFVKPARSIEYIVVDFVITNTGADFV